MILTFGVGMVKSTRISAEDLLFYPHAVVFLVLYFVCLESMCCMF